MYLFLMNGKFVLRLFLFLGQSSLLRHNNLADFPPSTKWRQIKTDTARIIFEGAVDSQAQKFAAIIHQFNRQNPNPLGNKVRPYNILST